MATTISVANETKASASRITSDGEKITYEMLVIQQPERARACGSGAKSSADRRPVDPPPIVQLRVFKNGEDVTFQYNANFFLFATLENARAIAQGRVAPSPSTVPVLTGTPVAGMAYLDRPNPAGYFVFPDLSVRHEGKYRLGFSLYEELKETKDLDTEQITNVEILSQTANPAHVSHRLEVKSQPFTVFSAKKFPGLTESTQLSRLVAEQGCRVRIRRDVRMRRRENKGVGKDEWDGYDEATSDRRHSQTPDAYGPHSIATPNGTFDGSDRPRSVSNASISSYAMPQRRPSMEQMGQSYQQPYGQQMAPQGPPSQGMYPPQIPYSAPQQQPFQAPPAHPIQPPQMSYSQPPQPQYTPPPPPQQPMSMPSSSASYGYTMAQQPTMPQQSMHQQTYSQQPAYDHSRHNSVDNAVTPSSYRRASMAAEQAQQHSTHYQSMSNAWPETTQTYAPAPSYAPTTQPYAPVDSSSSYHTAGSSQGNWNPNSSWDNRRNQSYSSQQPSVPSSMPSMPSMPSALSSSQHQMPQPLAPLRTIQPAMPPPASVSASSPISAESVSSPGFSEMNAASSRSSVGSAPPAPIFPSHMAPAQQQHTGNKRSYSSTFDTHHVEQPLRYGARPDVNGYAAYMPPPPAFASDGPEEMESQEDMNAMSYRRADGTERRRRIPIPA